MIRFPYGRYRPAEADVFLYLKKAHLCALYRWRFLYRSAGL